MLAVENHCRAQKEALRMAIVAKGESITVCAHQACFVARSFGAELTQLLAAEECDQIGYVSAMNARIDRRCCVDDWKCVVVESLQTGKVGDSGRS